MMHGLAEVVQALAAPVADHIWQSTVFALLAACLTLVLRNNPARHRFTIWFISSVKFLVPFALLVRVGHSFGTERGTPPPRLFVSVLEVAGQPFGRSTSVSHATGDEKFAGALSALLLVLWFIGFAIVLLTWSRRWLQASRIRQSAEPIDQGLEFDILRSLTEAAGVRPIPILLSRHRLEPGVFGIIRPVLLWPAGISGELQEPEMQAILAHEVWHARRHDNLLAAVQMFLEAAFWFHPLVWWLGARQMAEREHACDEGVLALGSEPAAYAEGILKACKHHVATALPCVAGVNGSNLKQRIVRIMNGKRITALSTGKKLLFSALAFATIAAPVLFGIDSAPRAMAQVSSSGTRSGPLRIAAITRNNAGGPTLFKHTADGTVITNASVKTLIETAYSLKDNQLTGGPAWLDQEHFNIAYTGGEPSNSAGSLVSNEALKEILAQRFHLAIRQQTKPGPMFALVVGEGGAKFPNATPPKLPGTNEPILQTRVFTKDGQGQIDITGGPGGLADTLAAQVGRPIVDRTGLTGIYSISFHWATAASAANISGDLQRQLGLALVSQEGPIETATIDSVTMPAGS